MIYATSFQCCADQACNLDGPASNALGSCDVVSCGIVASGRVLGLGVADAQQVLGVVWLVMRRVGQGHDKAILHTRGAVVEGTAPDRLALEQPSGSLAS